MGGFGIASEKVPTMKPLDADKKPETAEAKPAENVPAAPAAEEKIDFSNVQIEPLFADFVDFDTFSKSDFRAVKVKACEAVKKSKKLLKFTLDDGTGTDRVILSGIHAYYEPEALVGKTCIAITNLPPRPMMASTPAVCSSPPCTTKTGKKGCTCSWSIRTSRPAQSCTKIHMQKPFACRSCARKGLFRFRGCARYCAGWKFV